MKRFVASALAALMLLTVFASAAMADGNNTTSANNTLEIRGPVYNGSSLTDILANNAYGNGTAITMDASKFAAFFYDIDNNVTTESLSIKNTSDTKDRVIGKDALVYKTTIGQTDYKYGDWGNYSVLGFFADKYIPLKSNDASKLAKLVLDSDDKYTLKTGEKLDLGDGYSLEAKQVDVDGKKVWLELDKDGQYVDDQIVSTDSGDSTWTCKVDGVQGEDNVPVLKVHVNQVFQGAVDSIAQVDGLWLIDYANAIKINSDDEYGKLNNVAINGPTITISNDDTMTLTKDSDQEIGQGLYFKVADSDDLRFYAYKQITEPGTYQVRGQVASGAAKWDASNFAGFFYDLKKNVQTESLNVTKVDGNVIPKNDLVYKTTVGNVDYQSGDFNGSYPVLGFFADEYVPLKASDASKLAKLVVDSDDKYTLKTGEKLDLGQGYTLEAKQVDVDGKKVWLEFDKDGQYVDDQIVSTDSGDHVWTCEVDGVQGEDNVPVLKVHVNQVFQGAVDSIAQVDGLWLIDYANAIKINTDDSYGKLNNVGISGSTITISNDDSLTLSRDSDVEIGQGISFKVADTQADQLRYYPFVEKTVGNETTSDNNTATGPSISGGNVSTSENANVTSEENANVTSEENANVTPEENANVTPEENSTSTQAPTQENNTTQDGKKSPGFGVLSGIVGLAGVVYLVRRNN
ncbi:S-layer protein domain-containing protein [Methanosarcina sp. UBA5]|uniref:S-layer protein domain-containing protein n=1 Tax=Methanosarcina sp. UBA5 TaxID=1915593 RepID=UPI0025DB3110|nr:S-layer protein domain-containing protein [Methanosarcina sp. UBA5]